MRTLEAQLKHLESEIEGFVAKNNGQQERVEHVMAGV
jgi:hypothetical protein